MRRRKFIQHAIGGGLALAAARLSGAIPQPAVPGGPAAGNANRAATRLDAKIRGVNLGGWLVLEKWMVPTVYRGVDAPDEYELSLALGGQARARLQRHRETFITAEDFRWIKDRGLNAVRLPVGYWALEAPKPFLDAADFVDLALEQSRQIGLKLLLDLHGAPGSQNGWDHSGRAGKIGWHTDRGNIQETMRVLESFAEKYGRHPALLGVELLNEPSDQIPVEILKDAYQEAYARIRKHAGPEVAVVFHDSFRPMAWQNFMQEPEYRNVLLDTHLYQSFGREDQERSAEEHLVYALGRKSLLEGMQRQELPTIVGEWSLALPSRSRQNLSSFQGDLLNGAYADSQLLSFEDTSGWFFWSYKLESKNPWNFRHCVERGWLPEHFPV
jgi:glucan 1,3-beta-glucosidase